jgi:hypothetical protein
METPKHPLARPGMVVLDKIEVNARLPIPVPVVGLREKPSLVTTDNWLDAQNSDDRSFTHSDHPGHRSILIILFDILRYTLRI